MNGRWGTRRGSSACAALLAGTADAPDRRPLATTSRFRFFTHALAMGALCTAVIGAWSRPAAADGTEPQTQPSDLPPIRWIVVERNGQKAVATPASVDCSRFVMTQRTAARHLKASLRISKWDYDHTIDWLPCLSEGRVGFTDGRLAYWSIGEGGGSSVTFDDGQAVHLYCANCRVPRTNSWQHEYEKK
jgi:hypothetical protein